MSVFFYDSNIVMLSQVAQTPHIVILKFFILRKYLLMIVGAKSYL